VQVIEWAVEDPIWTRAAVLHPAARNTAFVLVCAKQIRAHHRMHLEGWIDSRGVAVPLPEDRELNSGERIGLIKHNLFAPLSSRSHVREQRGKYLQEGSERRNQTSVVIVRSEQPANHLGGSGGGREVSHGNTACLPQGLWVAGKVLFMVGRESDE
jgi:hypothetical protein